MATNRKVLLTVADSSATWRAADYVAELASTTSHVGICPVHAAEPMPTELQEFSGADPQREEVLQEQLKEKQNRWERDARKAAVPLLEQAQSRLQKAGIRSDQIESRVLVLLHREDLVDEIIKTVRERGCDTIVMGRNSYPWLEELFVGISVTK